MKKFKLTALLLALTLALGLLLSACNKDDGQTPAAKNTETPAPSANLDVTKAPAPEVDPVDEPSKDPGSNKDTDGLDLGAFFIYVMENYDIPALDGTALDGEFLANFYPGLESIETAQTEVHIAMMSGTACELAMVELAPGGSLNEITDVFQARIDAQVDGGAFYPATIEAWQNSSIIVSYGNYVCMYVGASYEEISQAFISYVSTGELPAAG